MWVIHLRTDHVQHRHAYLRRSSPVFGPCEGQPTLLTIQLARKLPLARVRRDRRPGPRQANRVGQGLDVVGAMQASAVEEERRGSRDPAQIGAVDVLCDAIRADVAAEVTGEAVS